MLFTIHSWHYNPRSLEEHHSTSSSSKFALNFNIDLSRHVWIKKSYQKYKIRL